MKKIHEPYQDKYYPHQEWQTLTRLLHERNQGECFRCCRAKNISELTPFRIDHSVSTYTGDDSGRLEGFRRRYAEINEFVPLCAVCLRFCLRSDLRNYREIEWSYDYPQVGNVLILKEGQQFQYPAWRKTRNG